jgi:hypothetical protein
MPQTRMITNPIKINYKRMVYVALVLLVGSAFITKLPPTDTVVRAAASFLSTVAHDSTLVGDGTSSVPLGVANNGVGTSQIASGAVTAPKIASGQVVKSLNGLRDGVTLAAGSNVSLALTGQTLTISSLSGLTSVAHDATLIGDGTSTAPLGIAPSQVVKSFNGLTENVTLAAGSNISITSTGNTLTIASDVSPSPHINPLRVATLQWYQANQTRLNFSVGSGSEEIAFDGTNIWVLSRNSDQLWKLRATDGANLGSISAQNGASGIAFDGAHMWLTHRDGSRRVSKIRWGDGSPIFTQFVLPSNPNAIAFDGANIWVTNDAANTVTKIRATDGAILGAFSAGTQPFRIAFDGAHMWVTNSSTNAVTKLRATDGAIVGTFPVVNPFDIAFDGANMWVTNLSANTVTKLRASDGANLGIFATGSPVRLAFDGANMWITNMNGNSVTKLRASDGVNLGSFAVVDAPVGIAFDGANMWVVNSGAGVVTKL